MRNLNSYQEIKGKSSIDKMIEGETGEVPLYRSYGVRKKVNPLLTAFNLLFGKTLAIILFAFEFLIIAICAVAFFFWGGVLISTVMTVMLSAIAINIHTRVIRRRWRFTRKLKRMCKKNKYRLEFKQNFFDSLYWNDEEDLDFALRAGKYTYYVRYVTPKKPLSTVAFLSKNEIRYTKHARKNIFTVVFGFKDKSKILKLTFPEFVDEKDKYSIKAVIVNPKPRDIMVKNPEGATVPTGTGEKIYGYTIFTGKGFLETVRRNAEEKAEEISF